MKQNTLPQHIVLEGPDASGKKTQSTLLVERLQAAGHAAERLSFPDYSSPFGQLVTEYLEGRALSEDPAYASLLYAADRFLAAPHIRELLAAGTVVVGDRYVASNLAHQVARVQDPQKRAELAEWIDRTEYGVFGIPRANLTILLSVPYELCLAKAEERKLAAGSGRDIHEEDRKHIRLAWEQYQLLAKAGNWPVVECAPKGELLAREVIAEKVWQIVTQKNRP